MEQGGIAARAWLTVMLTVSHIIVHQLQRTLARAVAPEAAADAALLACSAWQRARRAAVAPPLSAACSGDLDFQRAAARLGALGPRGALAPDRSHTKGRPAAVMVREDSGARHLADRRVETPDPVVWGAHRITPRGMVIVIIMLCSSPSRRHHHVRGVTIEIDSWHAACSGRSPQATPV